MGKEDRSMTLVGHLQELRVRLIWVAIFFTVMLVVGFLLAEPVIEFFKQSPAAKNLDWHVFSLSDGIRVYIQFAFAIALTLSLPFTLFQLWRFVAPGLTKRERNLTLWFIPVAFILFLVGVSFAYFIIFPMIVQFLTEIATKLQVVEIYGFNQYFSFMFNMIIPFGILFELPVVVVFLTRIGIITPKLLIRFRKAAYLILVIVAASITPPELVSEILVSLPLILLYEFSIWLSRITAVRRKKSLEQMEEELNED